MKTSIVAGIVILGYGILFQSGTGKALLDTQAKTLKGGQSLAVKFTTQKLPAAAEDNRLVLSRPNKVRLETATGIYVSDGVTTWKFDKASNSFTETPATAKEAVMLTSSEGAWAWASFFGEPYKEAKSANLGQKRNLKGVLVQEIAIVLLDGKTITLFIDTKTNVPRGAVIKFSDQETLVIASEVLLGTEEASKDEFIFVPPAGATKLDRPRETEVRWASVSPIFRSRCMPCHNSGRVSGGYDLTSYGAVMAANIVNSGDPSGSKIVGSLRWTFGSPMPKNGSKIPEAEIQTVEKWIAGGAKE